MKTEDVSPQTIVAILIAAHRHGNRELERDMRSRLKDEYGVKLQFLRSYDGKGADHAE